MKSFNFVKPNSLQDAVALLSGESSNVRVLAGGTDVLIELKFDRSKTPDTIMSLKNLDELNFIRWDSNEGLSIGAMTTISSIEKSQVIQEKFPALFDGASSIGSVQVRNLGTMGGNICRAAPSGDLIPALVAYGANAVIQGPRGQRIVPLDGFFTGPGQTVLNKGEILFKLRIPAKASRLSAAYLKLGKRNAMEISTVGVAVALEMDGETCTDCRIALGSVAPTVIRPTKAEECLRGKKLTTEVIECAAGKAMEAAQPITDIRATAEYRKEMVGVMLSRAVAAARQRS